MLRNMFDALQIRTQDGKIVPELAVSWIKKDDTHYVFDIRQGVYFHNGMLMTADDVVFTFQRVLSNTGINGKISPWKGLLGPLIDVVKNDQNQVVFILENPFPPFLHALTHFQIVPEKTIRKFGDVAFGKNSIGTGPFKFVTGDLKGDVFMEKFNNYYGGSPELPPVKPPGLNQIIFRPIPDPDSRVSALISGQVGIIQAIPIYELKKLRNHPEIRVSSVLGTRSYQIELNNEIPPFNDVRVRRALNYAINWKSILSEVYSDYEQRLATCFLPSGFGFNTALKPYNYAPWKAKRLLKEAGYESSQHASIETVPIDSNQRKILQNNHREVLFQIKIWLPLNHYLKKYPLLPVPVLLHFIL